MVSPSTIKHKTLFFILQEPIGEKQWKQCNSNPLSFIPPSLSLLLLILTLASLAHMRFLMEGERKKRKIIYDEEDEDVKMEKFFALIRSAKELRDRLLDNEGSIQIQKKKVTPPTPTTTTAAAAAAEEEPELTPVIWKPQDFTEGGVLKTDLIKNLAVGSSEEENNRSDSSNHFKGCGRIGLDLNLSL